MAANPARSAELVLTSQSVDAERGRQDKVGRIAAYLRSLSPSEAAVAATDLAGELPQGRIGIGPALLAKASRVPLGPQGDTTIAKLHADLTEIAALSGPGSQDRRRRSVEALLSAMTPEERDFALRLLLDASDSDDDNAPSAPEAYIPDTGMEPAALLERADTETDQRERLFADVSEVERLATGC